MRSLGALETNRQDMNRRHFLWVASISLTGLVIGCAANPVTGRRQLMLISEDQEIQIDRQYSPHQFSSDYGVISDRSLNGYIQRTGRKMAARSHRADVPYSFRGVNATYVNAYAFPGGSIAATRGILLALENEAELAALLGHELGHVNARHTAERMSKQMVASTAVSGLSTLAASGSERLAPLAAGLGGVGAGMLLAKYSRDDEREADSLGMEYMVKAGNNPEGMVGLMDILRGLSARNPSVIERMFATHPMSEERYRTASIKMKEYRSAHGFPLNRERYMDHTAGLRKIKGAIVKMQNGEAAMVQGKFSNSERQFRAALNQAPDDYAGLLMMAKCQLAQEKYGEALRYAEQAKRVNPGEAQAHHIAGMAELRKKDFEAAYAEFDSYERMLPGNPNTVFLKGFTLEGMGRRPGAAKEYARYIEMDTQSKEAQHAYQRLQDWGYLEPKKKKKKR